jgi:hypothetical protein
MTNPKGPQNGQVPAHAPTGLYARSESALRIRAERVRRIVNRMRKTMPWLSDADIPACRGWAELEILSATCFAWLTRMNVLNPEGEPRRLLSEFRQLRQAQLSYERELAMTPLARASLKSAATSSAIDLAAQLAIAGEDDAADSVEKG